MKTIIFDWKRTLYDPDTKRLCPGALELLRYTYEKVVPVYLIGKGDKEMYEEVKRLKMRKYFIEVFFNKGEKDVKIFKKLLTTNPKDTIVIGDRVRSEIEIGNELGCCTIWVRQGKFANEGPEKGKEPPLYIAPSLRDCLDLLHTFNVL